MINPTTTKVDSQPSLTAEAPNVSGFEEVVENAKKSDRIEAAATSAVEDVQKNLLHVADSIEQRSGLNGQLSAEVAVTDNIAEHIQGVANASIDVVVVSEDKSVVVTGASGERKLAKLNPNQDVQSIQFDDGSAVVLVNDRIDEKTVQSAVTAAVERLVPDDAFGAAGNFKTWYNITFNFWESQPQVPLSARQSISILQAGQLAASNHAAIVDRVLDADNRSFAQTRATLMATQTGT
jgi:hypothetical protein